MTRRDKSLDGTKGYRWDHNWERSQNEALVATGIEP